MTRVLPTAVKQALLEEQEFSYAHLVKFEKPLLTASGKSAQRAKDYVYLTDSSIDLVFDDESTDIQGLSNGAQTYIANKILRVGDIAETTEARASSMSLSVAGAALNLAFIDDLTITSNTITAELTDFVDAGFREGDTIQLLSGSGLNDTARVRIDRFTNDNKRIHITPLSKIAGGLITEVASLSSETDVPYSVNFDSPEVEGVLSNRSDSRYARYINRDIFIYKAHIDISTGQIIGMDQSNNQGGPNLIFKGILATGKVQEAPDRGTTITWGITSHWGDFQRISGRLTSDPHHRALDGAGLPDLGAVIRPQYAGDLGFQHSESAVNLMSIYQVEETRYKEKKRGGLYGLLGAKKLVEYQVEVDREVDLRFNLDAKHLPVVYGVNKVDSIPFFVDTLNTDSKKIYVAYAICEGEIGGLYDIYVDDNSTICLDQNDSDTRSTQTDENTIDMLCEGRMDSGFTLRGNTVTSGTTRVTSSSAAPGVSDWAAGQQEIFYIEDNIGVPISGAFNGGALNSAAGITHEKGRGYSTPIDTRLIFHSGKSDQKADALLIANRNNFKVGSDYFSGDSSNYWGAAHRVLDTAYVVAEYTIGEGETTIPSLDFVVRGKGIQCYNYDFSYEQDPDYASTDASISNFQMGDTVTLKRTSNNNNITTTAVIADIFTITELEGTTRTHVRFVDDPQLPVTNFYMRNSSNQDYHFITHDHVANSGTVPEKLTEEIASVANNSSSGVDATVSLNASLAYIEAQIRSTILIIQDITGDADAQRAFQYELQSLYRQLNQVQNKLDGLGTTTTNSSTLVGKNATILDAVVLASGASSTDDAYNGRTIEVTKKYSDNTIKVQKRKIIDYDGGTRVAFVDRGFDTDAIPGNGDTYKVFSTAEDDIRVSINPALQLLDYLTADRYGRDLDLEKDIDKESFLEAARDCDTRSNVTVIANSSPTVGHRYEFAYGSNRFWHGKVKSSTAVTVGGSTRYNVEFEDVGGKLLRRWESWKSFSTGELYFYKNALHQAGGNGTISSTPSTTTSYSSLSLNNLSASGTLALYLPVTEGSRNDGNPVIKKWNGTTFVSGYSLYDSDDVKYWRYLGWENQDQRNVTRHQTNAVINTGNSVFENVNSMLGHFNGLLRYSSGKYSLAVGKAAAQPATETYSGITYTIGDISEDDIIGNINVDDPGQKGTFNQASVSINDPQNRFETRAVTLFNSTYLQEDRMVPKKGDVRTPYINNYFNARINAKQLLDNSRAALKVNFTIGPKGLLLRAGEIIRITHSRFGWTNKLYRIKNLSFKENCLVQVTAEEHNDSAYIVVPENPILTKPVEVIPANMSVPASPSGLTPGVAIDRGGIVLNWQNSSAFDSATYDVEIYRHTSQDRVNAKLVGISKSNTFTDTITGAGAQTFYYWIRYAVNTVSQRTSGVAPRRVFSAFHPTSNTGGVAASADGAIDGVSISITNDNITVVADEAGNVSSFANTNTSIKVFMTGALTYDDSSPYANNSFRIVSAVASGVTKGASSNTSNSFSLANISAMPGDTGSITFTIRVKDSVGTVRDFERVQTFTKSKRGAFGKTVELVANKYVINYSTAGTESDALTFTATARNFGAITPFFQFFVDSTSKQASASGTGTPPSKTFSLADADEPGIGGTKTILVQVRENSASGDIVAEDSVSIFGVQDGSDAITGFLTNEAHTVGSDFIGNSNLGAAGGTFKVFVGGTDVTTSCTFSVSSETDVDVSINSGTGAYVVNSFAAANTDGNATLLATVPANLAPSGNNTVISKVYTISRARAAAPVFTDKLTNDSHSFTASSTGVVSSTDLAAGGGTFQVFKDGTNVTSNSAVTFSKVSDTNITASINSNTGVYTISAFPASNTTGSAIFRATVANTFSGTGSALTFDKEYTCSKSNKGADGISGTGVAELTIYYQYSPYGSGGTASFPSTPSTGTFNFSTGVISSLPTGWSQSEPGTGTGTITVQSTTLATESSAGSGVSGTLSWNSPSFVRGAPGSTNFIFIYSSSQPSTPSATDVATNDGIPSGWSDGIPTNPNDGSRLWSSKGQAQLSGNILSGAGLKLVYNWETPVVHVQVKNDISLGNVENVDQTNANNITSGSLGVGRGGTGETNTNRFLNSNIGISTSGNAISIARGGYSTVSITGLGQGLVNLSGVSNNADVTGSNTSLNTSNVGGRTASQMVDGRDRAVTGLASNGDVDRAVPTAKGGTGETNTNRFLNSNIGISTSGNAISIARGGYSTVSITGLGQGLVNLSGVSNNADQTSANTSANTSAVGARTASQIVDGRDRAVTGLTSNGTVNIAVPTGKGGTGETNTNRFLNNQISLSTSGNAITVSRGGYSNQSITGLGQGLVGLSGVSNNADQTSANTANNTSNVGARTASQMVDGRDRAVTGLASNGDVNRAVPTGKGGTGQTNTNRFLNNQISLSTSGNAITVSRGGYSNQSITGLSQGLVGLSGVSNNADQTSANTAADVTNVSGTAAATVKNGAVRANAGLDSSGNVARAVPSSRLTAINTASVNQQIFIWTQLSNAGFSPNATNFTFIVNWKDGAGNNVAESRWTATRDTVNDDINSGGITANYSGSGVTASQSGANTTSSTVTFTRGTTSVRVTASIVSFSGFTFKESN